MSEETSNKRTCQKCGKTKSVLDFQENPYLAGGVYPWCTDCLEEYRLIKSGVNVILSEEWNREYSRAYHRAYKQRRKTKNPVRTSIRHARGAVMRLTRAAMQQVIPKALTIKSLRRPEVLLELVNILPTLRMTPTWVQFDEEMLTILPGGDAKGAEVVRVLPELHYPECMLARWNCAIQVGGVWFRENGTIEVPSLEINSAVSESLALLSKCLLEVRYYVTWEQE